MEAYSKANFATAFRERTKKFVVDNIKLFQLLPKTTEANILGKQLLRCSSSVGSNYRAACRARSEAEFFAKISIVTEEADECVFWLEVMIESAIIEKQKVEHLLIEATEILKVVSSARKTLSSKKNN